MLKYAIVKYAHICRKYAKNMQKICKICKATDTKKYAKICKKICKICTDMQHMQSRILYAELEYIWNLGTAMVPYEIIYDLMIL